MSSTLCMSHVLAGRPIVNAPQRHAARRSCKTVSTRAAVDLYQIAAVAERAVAEAGAAVSQAGDVAAQAGEVAKFGEVAAPSWVLPVGVVAVTLASILSGYLLKPGADASDDIKARDAKSGRYTK